MFRYARSVRLLVVLAVFTATFSIAPAVSAQAEPMTVPLSCWPTDQDVHVSGGQVVF